MTKKVHYTKAHKVTVTKNAKGKVVKIEIEPHIACSPI